LKKALQLYTMAVNILEKTRLGDGDEVNRLVYLAAVNMGHIYSHFCEGKAQTLPPVAAALLVTVKSSGIDIYSDDYRPFTMNALILWGQRVAAAAA
jgi:hypothetical protein